MDFEFNLEFDDLEQFLDEKIGALRDGIPEAGVKAANKVALRWWELAGGGGGSHYLGAPLDTGNLRASLSAGVQGQHVVSGSSAPFPGRNISKSTPNRSFQRPPVGVLEIVCGANAEYAAAVHELVAPKGLKMARIAGRGGYIEFNLKENMKDWMSFIADAIRKDFEKK